MFQRASLGRRLQYGALAVLTALLVSGCSGSPSPDEDEKAENRLVTGNGQADYTADSLVVGYNADSLRNYKAGRDFSAAGRYELAREHYLLALASANDPVLREALARELDSIDLMIKSLR